MMDLKVQIFSFIFSFIYGLFLFYMFKLFHRSLFMKKKLLRFMYNLFFCIILSSLYFLIIYNINGGVIHLYFFLLISFGFLLCYNFTNN